MNASTPSYEDVTINIPTKQETNIAIFSISKLNEAPSSTYAIIYDVIMRDKKIYINKTFKCNKIITW